MIWGWVSVVVVLGGLLFLHELGHFLAARAAGVEVEEFSLGLGPKLVGIRRKGTLYAIRLLPIVGYVRMAGMYPMENDGTIAAEESRAANARGTGFNSKPLGPRMGIVAAGPVMNFFVAFLLLVTVFGIVGIPSTPTLRIASVEPGTPAAASGFRAHDVIVAVGGKAVSSYDVLHQDVVNNPAGQPMQITVDRSGRALTLTVTPKDSLIGVILTPKVTRLSPLLAIWQGLVQTGSLLVQWILGIWALIHHSGTAEILGPVGIGTLIDQASTTGAATLLLLAAFISANLGLLNLLPIPALDGGRLGFMVIELLRGGKPVDPAKEGIVHFVGLAIMVAAIIAISVHDIVHLS